MLVRAMNGLIPCLLSVAAPLGAQAWTQLTHESLSNTSACSLARTKDGRLHIAWRSKGGRLESIRHISVEEPGRWKEESPVVEGWNSLSDPALLVQEGHLKAFFTGMNGSNPLGNGVLVAAAMGADNRWSLERRPCSKSVSPYSGGTPEIAQGKGTVLATWANGFNLGASPSGLEQSLQKECCAYYATPAVDAQSGEAMVGWYSNASQSLGLWVQRLQPMGEKQLAPNCLAKGPSGALDFGMPSHKVALTARLGAPGVYAAYVNGYPRPKSAQLWRVGDKEARRIAEGYIERLGLVPAPEGRLWAFWVVGTKVYAMRSNREATRFGEPIAFGAAPKAETVWRLTAEGSAGPLDLAGLQTAGGTGPDWWTAQVLPRLQVSATRTAEGLRVTVQDAGDPVSGALVEAGSAQARTDARGVALFKSDAKGGTVRMTGYAEAGFKLPVR